MREKRFVQVLACFALLVLFAGTASAREAMKETVPGVIRAYFKQNNLPGLAVSIWNKGHRTVYLQGKASVELNDPLTEMSVFRIGSVTKAYTALAVMILKERGKLTVEDKLSHYFPDFPHGNEIVIRNLLQHTSGIPNFANIDSFKDNQAKEWTPDEILVMLKDYINNKGSLDFSPGTTAVYSNSNYLLLGIIIEKVSGQSFGDFVAENVVTPLGMKDTRVGSDREIIPGRVAGYEVTDGKVLNAQFVSVVAPFATGDFMSRPTEVVKLARSFKPGVLLSKTSIDEMMAQTVLNNGTPFIHSDSSGDSSFGYCWELIRPKGKTEWIYTKSGGIAGFYAFFLYFKSADVGIAISSNAWGEFTLLDLGLKLGNVLKATK